MDKISPLYTTSATATGGRNGHTASDDGIVKADLSLPKEMGGSGLPGRATPSTCSPPATRPATAARSTSSPSRRRRTPARRRSPARCRSARAKAVASGWR